jgi:hypothetical protein
VLEFRAASFASAGMAYPVEGAMPLTPRGPGVDAYAAIVRVSHGFKDLLPVTAGYPLDAESARMTGERRSALPRQGE